MFRHMLVTIVPSCDATIMFAKKLRISRLESMFEDKISLAAWRKLLAALLLAAIGLSLWLWHESLGILQFEMSSATDVSVNLTKNAKEAGSVYEEDPRAALGQKVADSYCLISNCNAIRCSSISGESDPGTVASNFIENIFKSSCSKAKSVSLLFDNCKFPENKLRKNWLRTNVSIDELTLNSCSLTEIEDDAFSMPIYEGTHIITLVKNKLVCLRRAMFSHLTELQTLTISEDIIANSEFNLLENVASTLEILDLCSAIDNPEVLRNITGGYRLPNVQILSLRGNSIPVIDGGMFKGVPHVKSLYMDDSKIKTITQGELDPMASSLELLVMNSNDITSLPEGLFDAILRSKHKFSMAIGDNPWHCVCNLKWLQSLIKDQPGIVLGVPVCQSPEINALKSFTDADFSCQSNSSLSNDSTEQTTQSTNHDWVQTSTQTPVTTRDNVSLTCSISGGLQAGSSRKLLSIDYQLSPRVPNFLISSTTDEGILINLPDPEEGVTLLWFANDNVKQSLRCAKNLKSSYLLENIDPQTSYTVCLLADNENTVSPLNCLAATTGPTYWYRAWLTNADKSLAFLLLILSFLLLFLFAVFVTFLLIRRHPSLLRGSKRVVLVKRRIADAIVLPKGVNIDGEERRNSVVSCNKLHEDGYITALPPAPIPVPRESRKISLQSDRNSYVSGVEPTETQLASWRLTRMRSEIQKKFEAPPLPPHPISLIPSLSFAMDSRDDSSEYLVSTV